MKTIAILVLSLTFLVATSGLCQTPLTAPGGGFDEDGNNCATISVAGTHVSGSSHEPCPSRSVGVCFNAADWIVSITPATSAYDPAGQSAPTENTTLTPPNGGNPATSGDAKLANVSINSSGNMTGTSNAAATAMGMIRSAGDSGASGVTTKITYTFKTTENNQTCTYTVTLTLSHNTTTGGVTGATAQ